MSLALRNDVCSDTCVKVYDPLLQGDSKLIGVYENFNKAGNRLGIPPADVQKRCVRKTQIYSSVLKKDIALRMSALKPGDKELIEKTLKNIPL